MGDAIEMMLEGLLCNACGGFVDGDTVGYPRSCEDCWEENENG